jgi:exodeoxyribonuclease-3
MGKNIRIATYNANSIRARLPIVLDWLEQEKPDVLAVQETKVRNEEFPLGDFEAKGWKVAFHGQKSYNGVAFISKEPLEAVENRLYPDDPEEDARFIRCIYRGVQLFNTYVPQGYLIDSPKYQKKLKFLKDLKAYFSKKLKPGAAALWMGDLNVAPEAIDLADPEKNEDNVCFHIDARTAFKSAMDGMWVDLFREKEKGPGHYTFWDYFPHTFRHNKGWRIDHILGTHPMAERLKKIWIDKEPRTREKPSDHTFLVAEFSD